MLVPIGIAGSTDGSDENDGSTIGILGYEDYEDQQGGNDMSSDYDHQHGNLLTPNGNISYAEKTVDGVDEQHTVFDQGDCVRKSQPDQKNNLSSSFPNTVEGGFVSGVRSSFASSSRSNSSSIGTNGTNNSLSSRDSALEGDKKCTLSSCLLYTSDAADE